MNTLNSNENISVDIILSKTTQLAKQHKFLWIQSSSDSEISYLLKSAYDQLKQNTKLNICCEDVKFVAMTLLDNLSGTQANWRCIKESKVLFLKDSDYLCGKTTTQEELSILISEKTAVGEQVILVTKCKPEDLPVLSEKLSNKYELIKI